MHVAAARHQAERRAGKGTPTSGQFSRWGPAQPAAGGRREGPPGPRWSLLGRDLGGQRHPDGCVVRAVRCAPRSGAGQRSAFPCGRHHLDRWGFPRGTAFAQQRRCGTHVGRAGPHQAGFALPRVPTRGRRSLACGAIGTVGGPAWDCIFTAKAVRHPRWQSRTSLAQVSRSRACPHHHAERRAGKGTPTSGRHSPPKAGGEKEAIPDRLGSRPPRPSGPLCRPPPGELARGRRSRCLTRHPSLMGVRRTCIFTATGRGSRTGRPGPGSGISPRAPPAGSPL